MQETLEMLLNMITELKNELSTLQDRVSELEQQQGEHSQNCMCRRCTGE